ncbi:MAG: hypothetical protein CM1200mP18_16840 [Gammaproteobacteria bacterium]|nr:MAG: hypothetical protein CM1200mP18_16840 [Gammaproteobacteria bacterium]
MGGAQSGIELQRYVQSARCDESRPYPSGYAGHCSSFQANQLNGIDSEVLTPAQIKDIEPTINISQQARYPILGASFQPRGGVARHDAVAWGFARGADRYGVDVIQNCEVTGIRQRNGSVIGVETTKASSGLPRWVLLHPVIRVYGPDYAGLRMPIESHPLQALVSEPLKPVLNTVSCRTLFTATSANLIKANSWWVQA